jgi:polyhydroxyalkanoate synthesis regulator phasin
MARRKNTFTTFLSDIIDDSKDLVDDLIDRAKDVEEDTRKAARNVVDDEDDDSPSSSEVADLKKALAELTSKVDQLAKVKGAK